MFACADEERLTQFLRNELARPEQECLSSHLAACDQCQRHLNEMTARVSPSDVRRSIEVFEDRAARAEEQLEASQPRGANLRTPDQNRRVQQESRLSPEQLVNCGEVQSVTQSNVSPGFPQIDGFRILRLLGRGGMGVVYEAEEETLCRRVAIKILPSAALQDADQVRRFEREAQAAARLHHTNIVPVFGVGRQLGQPYFVMQFIEGSGLDRVLAELRRMRSSTTPGRAGSVELPAEPGHGGTGARLAARWQSPVSAASVARWLASETIAAYTGRHHLGSTSGDDSSATAVFPTPLVADRGGSFDPHFALPGSTEASAQSEPKRRYFEAVAKIGLQVAEALDYANRQGILHRDIKPSNLLLDPEGNVWVTDFGLANIAETEDITKSHQLVGTLRYMAPERFQGRCDARSDIYSLGLSLYELVALRPAFEGSDRAELIERILRDEPTRLRNLERRVPQDLETIVHKAIAAEQARRYQSGKQMAEDLGRFLNDLPIKARRVSQPERVVRWCRRNPWVSASLVLLVLGTGISSWQAVRTTAAEWTTRSAVQATIHALAKAESEAVRATEAEAATRKQRDRAAAEAAISKAVREFVQQDLLAQASAYNQLRLRTKPDPDLKVRTALDRSAEKIGQRFAGQPLVEASNRQTVGETYYQLGYYRQAVPHLQRTLDLRRSLQGVDDPDTLLAMRALGTVYLADDKLSDAEPLLVGAMEGLHKKGRADDPDVLDSMALVANLLYEQGKHAAAEHLLTEIRDAHLLRLGPDDPKTLDVTNTLGLVYLEENRPELAERTLTDVRNRFEKTLGARHPMTLLVKQNLSDVYSRRGKKNEAMQALIDAIDGQTKAIGRKHPDTLGSIVKLAMLYTESQSFDTAEPLLKEALEGGRAALDRNHETIIAALSGLAVVHVSRRNMKELGAVLVEAAEILQHRRGLLDGTAAAASCSAGMCFFIQNEYARAEPFLRDHLMYWTTKEPGRAERYLIELTFGVCLLAQRKFKEAGSHLRGAYDGLRTKRPNTPPLENVQLGRLIYELLRLPDGNGQPLSKSVLSVILTDRRLEAIAFDLQFPANPFAAQLTGKGVTDCPQ
jgi:serine/threonine protein kinase